jgi:biotin synthase-related radical SAM superfamily protein
MKKVEEKIKRNKELLIKALEKSLGIVTPACNEVGISRNQFYIYYHSDEDFKKRVDDINEVTLDFAENQLLKKIKEGSERSILFYMKYKGRKRGYNDTLEINGDLNHNIQIIKLVGPEDDLYGTTD